MARIGRPVTLVRIGLPSSPFVRSTCEREGLGRGRGRGRERGRAGGSDAPSGAATITNSCASPPLLSIVTATGPDGIVPLRLIFHSLNVNTGCEPLAGVEPVGSELVVSLLQPAPPTEMGTRALTAMIRHRKGPPRQVCDALRLDRDRTGRGCQSCSLYQAIPAACRGATQVLADGAAGECLGESSAARGLSW